MTSDDLDGSSQFAAVISIACSPKRTEKLMRMCLEYNCAGPYHLTSLPPLIARSADLIKSTMRRRQGFRVGKRALTSRLPRSIHQEPDRGRQENARGSNDEASDVAQREP